MEVDVRKRAWKIRAVVYGLLLALVVLVLGARPSSPREPGPLHILRGSTGQGYEVEMSMGGARVHSFRIRWIWAKCPGRRPIGTSWSPIAGQANLRYDEHGDRIALHEWPAPPGNRSEGAFMHARIYNDGHNVDGTIAYRQDGCASVPVRFSASG